MYRPLVVLGLPFLITIFGLSYLPPTIIGILAAIGVLITFLANKDKTMLVIIIISIVFAFNIFKNYEENDLFDTSLFDNKNGNITAKVLNKSITNSGNSTGYTIEILDSDIENLPTGFKGILYADFEVFIDYYDIINVNMTCRQITDTESFNFSSYYKSNGILMQFFSYSYPTVLKHNNSGLLYHSKILNDKLCDRIDNFFNTQYAGMLKAILLGYDRDLDDVLYKNASLAGLSHIFVVSGMHIGLVVNLCSKLLNLIHVKIKIRNLICIVLTWLFVSLTGFGIPAIRAGFMITMILFATLIERSNDDLNTLFFTGFIMISLNPYSINSLSFQLSFSAVLGIILLSKYIEEKLILLLYTKLKLNTISLITKIVISSISITISSSIGMLPVSILVFKGISLISFISNTIVGPLLPMILILGILLLIFSSIPLIANVIFIPLLGLLFLVKFLTNLFASFTFSYLGLNFESIYLYIYGISLITIALIALNFKIRYLFKPIFIFTVIFIVSTYISNYNVLTFTIFNNSDGVSLVLSNKNSATIINFEDNNRNDIDIANFLISKNITTINNYVNFNQNNILIDDLTYLAEFIPIRYMLYNPHDTISDYINFKNTTTIKHENYRIYSNKNANSSNYLDIYYGDIGSLILGEISGLTILITNSIDIANNFEYDILFTNKNQDIIIKNNKTVVFLDDDTDKRKSIDFKVSNK